MRVVASCFFSLSLLCLTAHAEETTTPTPTTAQPQVQAQASATPKPAANTKPATNVAPAKPVSNSGPAPLVEMTAAQIAQKKADEDLKIKALVKDQTNRLQQLEKANLDALAQNQALQLKNDNLGVQVQVLQSESTAQLFMYGAATLGVGVLIGFMLAGYIYTKRRRQW
ncbi:hypothetical protein [Acinetobacter sp. MD2(2019)]|uniref:hypothetical protein n=1 Tax=Acinetobacter sp. MD2(2019) TaxID=2605273 RepID=UPI002D1E9399|nr:hypothetical protein [Acinetobacter sp. MD2(2019)]MEB3754290.1 hypothetical protein [Acinetobacter sp. MD2(2019)]